MIYSFPEEVFAAFYTSARAEIIQRFKLRNNVLIFYLGAIGAIFSLGLSEDKHFKVILIIPYISLAVLLIIVQHNFVIDSIGKFCANEYNYYFTKLKIKKIPQWDNSKEAEKLKKTESLLLFFGHSILILYLRFSASIITIMLL